MSESFPATDRPAATERSDHGGVEELDAGNPRREPPACRRGQAGGNAARKRREGSRCDAGTVPRADEIREASRREGEGASGMTMARSDDTPRSFALPFEALLFLSLSLSLCSMYACIW